MRKQSRAEQVAISIAIAVAIATSFYAGVSIGRGMAPASLASKRLELLQLVADRNKAQQESCDMFRKTVEETDWCTGEPKGENDGK